MAALLAGQLVTVSGFAYAMGIHHESTECPLHVRTGVPSPDFLFLASLSQPGCCLALGTQTYTLLEAQIKGGTPLPASQWTLCAEGSQ